MHDKLKMLVKDFIIFAALIFLISVLVRRLRKFIHVQKGSLVHELDVSFFDTLQIVQRHAGITRQIVETHTPHEQDNPSRKKIKLLRKQLDDIERKYTRNAPSIALLGPIGTASIVLKEKELVRKLTTASLAINDILADLLNKPLIDKEKRKKISLEQLIKLNTLYTKEAQRIL